MYLREGTVIPEITLVGEAIPDVSELALLDVLFDWVESLLFANLFTSVSYHTEQRRRV